MTQVCTVSCPMGCRALEQPESRRALQFSDEQLLRRPVRQQLYAQLKAGAMALQVSAACIRCPMHAHAYSIVCRSRSCRLNFWTWSTDVMQLY